MGGLGRHSVLDDVCWCTVRVMAMFMVTSFITFVGISSCRWKGDFELIFIFSLDFVNNLINKSCVHSLNEEAGIKLSFGKKKKPSGGEGNNRVLFASTWDKHQLH
jgi:hypothetical protein